MKIRVLPQEIREKIAAGEVVERPASVVKELIENALDAAAESIRVEIQQAGKVLVQVGDDGVGMAPEDVPLAFERFATSKIRNEGDLYALRTFGFRGEALPSIASVSRLTLITRERGALFGTEAKVEGGKLVSLKQVGHPVGTTVEVRDLFFNTPARRKFLRTPRVEYGHIVGAFTKFALAFPEKGFSFTSDGKEFYALPPSSLKERVASLFGPEIASHLEEFEAEGTVGRAFGFVVPGPLVWNRRYFLFVNRRPVKSSLLFRAVRDALRGQGLAILFVEVHPSQVDVNIHPSKTEVRFRNEEGVYDLVRDALERRAPSVFKAEKVAEPREAYQAGKGFHLFGQLEGTFLLALFQGRLYLIDQHAAAERVIYEKLLERQKKGGRLGRALLSPKVVVLSEGERWIWDTSREALEALGFTLEPFGPEAFALRAIPDFLDPREAEVVFKRLIGSLKEAPRAKRAEEAAKTLSCLAAVKAGTVLSPEEQERLIQEWSNTDNPHACVHNRPVYFCLSLDEVRRKVGRMGPPCEPG
ncbi:MAG: DNA mismatch repair endonuclease MutL [Candidatus Methylomirabilales bacterium]